MGELSIGLMNDQTNLKTPSWRLIVVAMVGGVIAVWLLIRVLSALAALIKFGIIIAVVAAIASFVMKQIDGDKKK
jgi:hypothetical protein